MRRLRSSSRHCDVGSDVTLRPPLAPKTRRVEVIVKLGGSALTDKTRTHTLHTGRFRAALDAICRGHSSGLGLIVVHGAGSFGHFEAEAHQVCGGNASALGMSTTHAAVVRLNGMVVDGLIERGVPAVGVSPLLVPAKVRTDFVAALLDRGHVPVLHGDACYAGDGRTAVLSGDVLVGMLAGAFEFVRRVVFVSDVCGVLDRPPREGGEVVKRIRVNESGRVRVEGEVRTGGGGADVTGGILGKVAAAGKCVAEGAGRVTAFIVKVGSEEAEWAMMGRLPEPWSRMQCTRIYFEEENAGEAVEIVARKRWFGGGVEREL